MPATTPLGIPYPLATDPVSDGATAMQNIATWLDPRVRIAAGSVTVPVANSNMGSVTVTFPSGRFTAGPLIAATGQSSWAVVSTNVPTAASVTITVRHSDNVAVTANPVVRWIAIQGW